MADVAEIDCDRFADVDVDNIMSRVQRRPLTFNRTRSLYKAPEFTKRFASDETIEEGSDFRLDCRITSFPRPHLRWFKDDDEITRDLDNHPRIHIESLEDGVFEVLIDDVTREDEGTYRCKAENAEGSCSSMFYLSVSAKCPRRSKSQSPSRRTVSFPPLVPTIVEKVDEEEKAAEEISAQPPSPLTPLYEDNKLRTGTTWPKFLGDWAYVQIRVNSVSFDSEPGDDCVIAEDEVFSNMIELAVANREGDYQTVTPSEETMDVTPSPEQDITLLSQQGVTPLPQQMSEPTSIDDNTDKDNYSDVVSEKVEIKNNVSSEKRKFDDQRENVVSESKVCVVSFPKTKDAKERPVALVKPTRDGFNSDDVDLSINDSEMNKDEGIIVFPEKPKKGSSYKDTQNNLKVVSKIFYLSSPTQELISCPKYEADSKPLDSLPEEMVYFSDGDTRISSPDDEIIICSSPDELVPYNQLPYNNLGEYGCNINHLPEEYFLYPLIEEDGETHVEEQITQTPVLLNESCLCPTSSEIQPDSLRVVTRELDKRPSEYRSRSPINFPISKSECKFLGTIKTVPRRPKEFRYYNTPDANAASQNVKRSPRDKSKVRFVKGEAISEDVTKQRTVPVESCQRTAISKHIKVKHKDHRDTKLENVHSNLKENVGSKRRPLEVTASPKNKGVVKSGIPCVIGPKQTRSIELLSQDFFLLSGFTYFSLILDVPPEDFVVNILFAFIMYSVTLRLCKLCKIFDSVD